MKQQIKWTATSIKRRNTQEGETIEERLRRVKANKDQIKDAAPAIYTRRDEGILPEHDIRTNRMEEALKVHDLKSRTHKSKRQDNIGKQAKEGQAEEAKTDKTTEKGNGETTV